MGSDDFRPPDRVCSRDGSLLWRLDVSVLGSHQEPSRCVVPLFFLGLAGSLLPPPQSQKIRTELTLLMTSQRTIRVSPRTSSRPSPSRAASAPSSVRRSRPRSFPTPSAAPRPKRGTASRTASTAASSCSLAWRWGSGLDWRRSSGFCRLRSVSHDFPSLLRVQTLELDPAPGNELRMQPLPYFPPSNDTQMSRFVAIDCSLGTGPCSSAPPQPRSNLRPLPACPRTAIPRKGPIRFVPHDSVHASIAPLTRLLYEVELAEPPGWRRRLPEELRQLRTPPPTPLLRKSCHFDREQGKTTHSYMRLLGARRHCGPPQSYRHWGSASGAASAESTKRKGGVSRPFLKSLSCPELIGLVPAANQFYFQVFIATLIGWLVLLVIQVSRDEEAQRTLR